MLLDFNADGTVLYFFQGWHHEDAKIIVDTFRNDKEERTVSSDVFKGPINPAIGDEAFFFASDNLVFFARGLLSTLALKSIPPMTKPRPFWPGTA